MKETNISIVRNHSLANAFTHSGVFHADEVMATAILARRQRISICRCSVLPQHISKDAIVYDMGGGMYDHHQSGGNGVRENGIPYAACGLIWREFGRASIAEENPELSEESVEQVWNRIDNSVLQEIDAVDNGDGRFCAGQWVSMSISKVLSAFNPTWDSHEDSDEAFLRAVETARVLLDNAIKNAVSRVKAERVVVDAINRTSDSVLVLSQYVPWKESLLSDLSEKGKDILYVVYPSTREGYCCQCVPATEDNFKQKKPLPELWRGLDRTVLREKTGVATALFCHPAGFICGAETLEDTIQLAKIAACYKV